MKNQTEFLAEAIPHEIKFSGIPIEECEFDLTNLPLDIVKIGAYRLKNSMFKNHLYWYGYEFQEQLDSQTRTAFINRLKGINGESLPAPLLRKIIELPMNALSSKISSYKITNFIYPLSGRSKLVTQMIRVIGEWLSRDIKSCAFELVKTAPINIEFDWEQFKRDFGSEPAYEQQLQHVENQILPFIRELDYFSLAHSVKPKYRPYIKNFLDFSDLSMVEEYAALKGQKLLVVDDINTSGSTLNEILRILNKVNANCNIFIYTLLGRP